jgi:hypothetical protein
MKSAFHKLISCVVLLAIMPMTAGAQTGDGQPQAIAPDENQPLLKQITGTVLTPDSKPAAGARLALIAFEWQPTNELTLHGLQRKGESCGKESPTQTDGFVSMSLGFSSQHYSMHNC